MACVDFCFYSYCYFGYDPLYNWQTFAKRHLLWNKAIVISLAVYRNKLKWKQAFLCIFRPIVKI